MRFNPFALLLAGVCVLSAPCAARQVDLLMFGTDPAVGQPGDEPSVPMAMMASANEYPPQERQPARPTLAGLDKTALHRCSLSSYRPAWWLPALTELRRAGYYASMARVACENGLSPHLLDAVISQESGYQAGAVSRAGAMGIMQLMPGTARELGLDRPWDAIANMRAGARYLRSQLDRFGRVDLALAAYNAGPHRSSLTLGRVPAIPETVHYVRVVTANWSRLVQRQEPLREEAMLQAGTGMDAVRAQAAENALRASGYREVSFIVFSETGRAGAA